MPMLSETGQVQLQLPGQLTLSLPRSSATALMAQLAQQLGTTGSDVASNEVSYPDEHPVWTRTSSEYRPGFADWEEASVADTEAFYLSITTSKTRELLDLLIDNPGRQLTTDEIIDLAPETFVSNRAIAGSINGFRRPLETAKRNYPFHWWQGKGIPSRYGMKPGVATTFSIARSNVDPS